MICVILSVRGCLHGKTRTGASFIPGWLRDFVSRLHDDWAFSSSHVQRVEADEAILDWQKLRMCYPFQSTWKPISHRNEWLFRVYMILLRKLVPEWNFRPGARTGVNSRWGDSRRHDILYHVNKCRAMRGNRSELAPARKSPRCHVNTPSSFKWWITMPLYPVRFCQTYPLSLDYISIMRLYEVFESYRVLYIESLPSYSPIAIICVDFCFPTFSTLASEILGPLSLLTSLVRRPFP